MLRAERVDVLLRPGELRMVRRSGILRRPGSNARVVALSPERAGTSAGEPWRNCVDRLAEGLAAEGIGAGRMHVELSDHYARYALLPWSENLLTDSERIAFARLQFSEVFGALSEGWTIAADQQPAGEPSFACAVDASLLEALRELCRQRGMRLAAVQPCLAARLNRHRASLRQARFCVASVEPGRLTLAFRDGGGWQAVRSRRVDSLAPAELSRALRQEAVAGSAAGEGCLYLIGEGTQALATAAVRGWSVIPVEDRGGRAARAASPALQR
jgi:hypothetical protein